MTKKKINKVEVQELTSSVVEGRYTEVIDTLYFGGDKQHYLFIKCHDVNHNDEWISVRLMEEVDTLNCLDWSKVANLQLVKRLDVDVYNDLKSDDSKMRAYLQSIQDGLAAKTAEQYKKLEKIYDFIYTEFNIYPITVPLRLRAELERLFKYIMWDKRRDYLKVDYIE